MKHLTFITFAFILCCVTAFGQNKGAFTFMNGKDHNFGQIPMGQNAAYTFEFKNTGNGDIVISGIKSDNVHLKFKFPQKPVKAGRKGVITVSFVAQDDDDIGSFQNDVFVASNATPAPYAFIQVNGAIVPAQKGYTPRMDDTTSTYKIPLQRKKERRTHDDKPVDVQ